MNPVELDDRPRPDRLLVAMLLALLLVVGAQTYYLAVYVAGPIRCQAEANEVFREALTLRSAAGVRERQAQREFLTGSMDGLTGDELDRYVAALDAADRDRANTPLPETEC